MIWIILLLILIFIVPHMNNTGWILFLLLCVGIAVFYICKNFMLLANIKHTRIIAERYGTKDKWEHSGTSYGDAGVNFFSKKTKHIYRQVTFLVTYRDGKEKPVVCKENSSLYRELIKHLIT